MEKIEIMDKLDKLENKVDGLLNTINESYDNLNAVEEISIEDLEELSLSDVDEVSLLKETFEDKNNFIIKIPDYEFRVSLIMILLRSGYKISMDNELISIEEDFERFY